jgi:inner membrane protein
LTANLVTVPGESALAQFPIREPLGVHASRKAGTSTPLLALSEHVAAASAYAISAATCVVLLTYYLRYPLGSLPRTSAFLVLFVALHASVYALLMSEDHALLMGSAMVFLVLAIAMIATRKVDWTALSARVRAPA